MKRIAMMALALMMMLGCVPAGGEEIPSLKEIYAGQFDFGAAAPQIAFSQKNLQELMIRQFNILTPENELKPDFVIDWAASRKAVQESGDQTAVKVSFTAAMPLLNFAKANGMKVHGHVLVWHNQTKEEFFHEDYNASAPVLSREAMLGRLENYLREVFTWLDENMPGLVISFDVVNEAIDDGTQWLRKSNWYNVVGEDYVQRAFEYARRYAPEGMLLYYNDYNTAYPGKLNGIVRLLESLIQDGSIDGYGFQMHHRVLEPGMTMLSNAVRKIAGLGLRLRVSELDVGVSGQTEADFQKQAKKYAQVMMLMKEYADQTEAVEVWGLTDNMSWRSYEYPLLFSAGCEPKPAFWAVAEPEKYAE